MKVLFVAPVEQGSGETITCLHMAESLTAQGHEVHFLASPFAQRLLGEHFPDRIRRLGDDLQANRRSWEEAVAELRPDVVVFADYPLLFVPTGVAPLADGPGWQEELESLDASLVTLDHFGFAQEEMALFLGPPHLSLYYQRFPAIPERMHILLPCPMHEPNPIPGRRGHPFRYWEVPLELADAARRQMRSRYLRSEDELLIFHSVPNWAWRQAAMLGLPFYRYLPAILDHYLRDLPGPVTVVSVNNGSLLQPPAGSAVRFVNLEPVSKPEFEALLFGSDLVLTENSVSIAMGKAICGLQTCAALRNSFRFLELLARLESPLKDLVLAMERERMGTVFPFNVYPAGMTEELDRIVLYRDNSLTRAFRALEIFGNGDTRRALQGLLTDEREREALRDAQREYVDRLRKLGDCTEVLERVVAEDRAA
ncbi:MAG TPA: DUF6365 family protein [Thermoanaerobaculia bacterium]|jgi:hypothetical protein